jgi:glycosyltransferase involved in cell wall biosynthesis
LGSRQVHANALVGIGNGMDGSIAHRSHRMRIAVIGGFTPSLTLFRGPMLRAMVDGGHDVTAITPEKDDAIIREVESWGVHWRQAPLRRAGLNPIADLVSYRALAALFREIRPHKTLAYTIKPVIWGTLAAARSGVPERYAMITGLGSVFEPGGWRKTIVARVAGELYRTALRRATVVFVQNPDDRADLLRLGLARADQMVLIDGSGVDTEHYAPSPLPPGPPRFLMVCRLLIDKGVREYAMAARQIKRTHPGVSFRLVGPTDPNPSAIPLKEVEGWVREGLLEYAGETRDVRPFLGDCSVYVLPSYYREGTPRTVLEAMAMGRPIITTDAPGCRETITHGVHGFLCRPRDADSLSEAMRRFIEQPELMKVMGDRSRERAVAKYDVHLVNACILKTMGLRGGV